MQAEYRLTVAKLRHIVANMPTCLDDRPVVTIWLPGSRIDLSCAGYIFDEDGAVMIEGDVRVGSALDDVSEAS